MVIAQAAFFLFYFFSDQAKQNIWQECVEMEKKKKKKCSGKCGRASDSISYCYSVIVGISIWWTLQTDVQQQSLIFVNGFIAAGILHLLPTLPSNWCLLAHIVMQSKLLQCWHSVLCERNPDLPKQFTSGCLYQEQNNVTIGKTQWFYIEYSQNCSPGLLRLKKYIIYFVK